MDIKKLAAEQDEYVIACRRHLHSHPELSCQEFETTKFILSELEKMNIPYVTFDGCTGCVAEINGTQPGRTVMLRADIDALPIDEANRDKNYCSTVPGVMHACGHDCHTAMLLSAAKILAAHRDEFKGTVKLIFQMGEEIGRKSEEYVRRGALEGVDAIFGMHVWALMEAGTFNFEAGERMACSDRFTLLIRGAAANASTPWLGRDALLAASACVMALQQISSRQNKAQNSLVVSVGMMNGGTEGNSLCDCVELVGTVRTFDRGLRKEMPDRIAQIVQKAAEAWGCAAECEYYFGPSPLINDDEELVRTARVAAEKVMGKDAFAPLRKMTGAEDFSVYMEHVPGAAGNPPKGVFGYLGARNPSKGIDCVHHHPSFDVDEAILKDGTAVYVQFAVDYLNSFPPVESRAS
ncbi:MAG: amidohydrolase [Fretibacterium sp.]|nr:amidohydrolase [Fretibacterium sp.]